MIHNIAIAPDGTRAIYDGKISRVNFASWISENYDCFVCKNCGNKLTTLVRRFSVGTIVPEIKELNNGDKEIIYDISNQICKSCTSANNARYMTELYLNSSDEEKDNRNRKISESVSNQMNSYDSYYRVVEGLIKAIKLDSLKYECMETLKSCKNLDDLYRLSSNVHSIVCSEYWDEYYDDRVKCFYTQDFINQQSECSTELWKDAKYRDKQIIGRLQYFIEALRKNYEDNCNLISDLYTKYSRRFPIKISDNLLEYYQQYKQQGVPCSLYFRYLSSIDLSIEGNHHILLESIFGEGGRTIVLDMKEHTLAHFLLVLDVLNDYDFDNEKYFSKPVLKILQSLNVRYQFGYIKFINQGINDYNTFWFTKELLDDTESIIRYN